MTSDLIQIVTAAIASATARGVPRLIRGPRLQTKTPPRGWRGGARSILNRKA